MGRKNSVGRGRATAMIGGLAVLGLLVAGCGDDKVSGTASGESGSTSTGFTSSNSEITSMLADAEAGKGPVYCEVSEDSGTMDMWLAGENQFKIEMRTDNDNLGAVRMESTVWIWSVEDGEGLKMTAAGEELSDMDSSVLFNGSVQAAESVKCKQDSRATTLAAPSEITFYTQADVASGKYSNAEAQVLLEKFDSLGS